MTRAEEITMAADAASRYESPSFFEAFVTGAKWADAHPDIDVRTMTAWRGGYKEAIEKACEWLKPYSVIEDNIINEFKKDFGL